MRVSDTMAASDITMPDGKFLADIVANLNVFASDPATSRGAGEIIYQSTAGTLKVNTQTVDPTTDPTWTSVGAGGWNGNATSNLDMNGYNIVEADSIIADTAHDLTLTVDTGQAFVFSKV